jgi:signal transduction histidine kinase
MLEISVADSGPGFPPQILEAGAQPFRSWRVGGTGLGLVMVRRFASDLGGELLLSNRDAGGACVTLRLPCRRQNG